MVAVFTLLTVLILSMTIVKIASVALSLTGLSRETARFQARSAFTGAGFTTTESERVMRHPVRRRIIMLLMLLGNAGIITAMSSLVLSFVRMNQKPGLAGTLWFRMALLFTGLVALWAVANSQWVDRRMSRIVAWALKRWTHLAVFDYAGLLHLSKGYGVSELTVQDQDWLAGHTLMELKLADEGVLVLGVEKQDGTYFGAPRGPIRAEAGDTLYLYGRTELIADLDRRPADFHGNWDHHKAVDQQLKIEIEEEEAQKEREVGSNESVNHANVPSSPRQPSTKSHGSSDLPRN